MVFHDEQSFQTPLCKTPSIKQSIANTVYLSTLRILSAHYMNVLLTGGSGTVGSQLLSFLSTHGKHELTVFDLPGKKAQKAFQAYQGKIEIKYGDLTNMQDIEQACKGVDVTIHLAAIIPPLADEKPDLAHKVNVVGTENLLRSLEKHSPKAFFLYASSVSVYGDRLTNHLIKVGDPLSPSLGDEYAVTKIKAEELISGSSLDWSIFRLSAIFGANNHQSPALMFHMPLATQMEITTDKDTARAFFHAIDKQKELRNRIFNLGGGEPCRVNFKDFLDRSFSISGLNGIEFPEKAFAEKNFHCGYYADGDDLENILNFRQDTMESFYDLLEAETSPVKKFLASLFKKSAKKHLLSLSEPYQAFQENDREGIERYFG